jgi:hypothetical protein
MPTQFKDMDLVSRLALMSLHCNEDEGDTLRDGACEITKLREQLSKAVGLCLRIENVLGSCLPKEQFHIYYEGGHSIHQEFKRFMEEG